MTNNSPQYPIKEPVNTKLLGLQSDNYLKFVRIMVGVKPRSSCTGLFKRLVILPVPCEYTFSLMSFIVNQEQLQTNSGVHSFNIGKKRPSS
jgi:hypothetical protein